MSDVVGARPACVLFLSLLIFAREHGFFPGTDVWDDDMVTFNYCLYKILDFVSTGGSNVFVIDKASGQLFVAPKCCTPEATVTHYRHQCLELHMVCTV